MAPVTVTSRSRADATGHKPPALLVFADDWGRHPSSAQHLVTQLLPRYRVGWVNTIGMRRPRLDRATWCRGLEKLRDWTVPVPSRRATRRNLDILKPVMWPWLSRERDRRINRRLLSAQLGRWIESTDGPVIALTALPIVADLVGLLPVRQWVYYCVDDFSQWPGVDNFALEALERQLVPKADVVIAASEALRKKLLGQRGDVELLTHGVDLAHWSNGVSTTPAEISGLPRPLIVFWGLIDRRMDVEFLRSLADALPRGTIVLVGPEADSDPELARIPRVRRIPAIGYDQLPGLAREADVLVMPYADLPVTRAMQPLKLTEYLATGKPVVVRDLPSTTVWADCLDMAATPEQFSGLVRRRLAEGLPADQAAARRRLAGESWSAKAAELERILFRKVLDASESPP